MWDLWASGSLGWAVWSHSLYILVVLLTFLKGVSIYFSCLEECGNAVLLRNSRNVERTTKLIADNDQIVILWVNLSPLMPLSILIWHFDDGGWERRLTQQVKVSHSSTGLWSGWPKHTINNCFHIHQMFHGPALPRIEAPVFVFPISYSGRLYVSCKTHEKSFVIWSQTDPNSLSESAQSDGW